MKKIAFHSNQLCLRGTEVAMYDYAHYNENLLGNKSFIISSKNRDLAALDKFKNRFDVFLYDDFKEVDAFIEKNNIDFVYFIKAGTKDEQLSKIAKNLIHVVFQNKDEHGERYVYISKWLASKIGNNSNNYIPHMIDLPGPTKDLRSALSIPKQATVIGRHGGFHEFNIPFAKQAVIDSLERTDLYYLFMNTEPFINHERVIYLQGTYNLEEKSNFINACDGMIHARINGESFGLSIGEFLFFDKPVITCPLGTDKNNIDMLKDKGLYYCNYQDCLVTLLNFNKDAYIQGTFKQIANEYTPEKVMNRFNKLFLE